MYELIVGAIFLVLGATAWLLVSAFRGTRCSGYLVLLAGLIGWPLLHRGFGVFVTVPALDVLTAGDSVGYWPFSLVSNGVLSISELLMRFGVSFKLMEIGLVFLGLWLVVRSSYDSATPSNTRLQRTGAGAPAAEAQIR